jgi:hypothetical protein
MEAEAGSPELVRQAQTRSVALDLIPESPYSEPTLTKLVIFLATPMPSNAVAQIAINCV